MFYFNLLLSALFIAGPSFLGCLCFASSDVEYYSQTPEQKYETKRKEVRIKYVETKSTDDSTNDSQTLSTREWTHWLCFKKVKSQRKSADLKTATVERPPTPERKPSRTDSVDSNRSNESFSNNAENPNLQEALLQCLMNAAKLSLSQLPAVSELIKKQLTCGATKIGELLWGQPQEEAQSPRTSFKEFSDYLFGEPLETGYGTTLQSVEAERQSLYGYSDEEIRVGNYGASRGNVWGQPLKTTPTPTATVLERPSLYGYSDEDRRVGNYGASRGNIWGQKTTPAATATILERPPSLGKKLSTSSKNSADSKRSFFRWGSRSDPTPSPPKSPPSSPPPGATPAPAPTELENVISQNTLSGFIEAARLCFGLFRDDGHGNLILAEDFHVSAPAEAIKLYPLGALTIGVAEAIVKNVKVEYDGDGNACYDINFRGLARGLGWAVMGATPFGAVVRIGHIATTFIQKQASINCNKRK